MMRIKYINKKYWQEKAAEAFLAGEFDMCTAIAVHIRGSKNIEEMSFHASIVAWETFVGKGNPDSPIRRYLQELEENKENALKEERRQAVNRILGLIQEEIDVPVPPSGDTDEIPSMYVGGRINRPT